MTVRGLLASSLLLAAACSSPHVGPPPDAPHVTRPLAAMPADLDLVLRVDLQRIRTTLGAPAMAAISEQALRGLHGADRGTDGLLLTALGETDTLYLGLRPAASLELADSVWVMVGKFPGFDPERAQSTPRFARAVDLGGDLRRFERGSP
ncbi:MAG TPA: hypothetical protein VGL19_19140, partial [Polyangiaceae bacterium]